MKGDVNANKLPQNYHCPLELASAGVVLHSTHSKLFKGGEYYYSACIVIYPVWSRVRW
jgi:hypothetical protein